MGESLATPSSLAAPFTGFDVLCVFVGKAEGAEKERKEKVRTWLEFGGESGRWKIGGK